MNILLLNPPARYQGMESLIVPPLGLAYVAATLRLAGFQVSIKDALAEQMSWNELETFLKDVHPDILGLSSMTPVIDTAFKAVRMARPYVSTIVMGGPHVSVWGQEVFQQCPEVDFCVIGEGEETVVELFDALVAGRCPDAIPGLMGRGFAGPPRSMIKDLDSLPFPARDLLPLARYRYPFSKTSRVTTLFTSRGCPFDCIFCDKSVFGSHWRARSADNILTEIDEIVQRFQTTSFIIYDDLFTLDKHRTKAICEGILQRGYKVDWKCESRVNLADPEILQIMKRAGCSMIAYGAESGNQHGLDYLNKRFKVEDTRRAFAFTHKAGIATMAYFILGIPTESFEDELQTIKFAREIDPTFAQFSTLSPYYGTRLFQEAKERNWYHEVYANNPLDKDLKRPIVNSPQWSERNLQRILNRAYLSFYLSPRYIIKKLLGIRSMAQMANVFRGFISLGKWLIKMGSLWRNRR